MLKRVVPWMCAVGLALLPSRVFASSFVVFDGEDPGLAVARVAVALSRPPDSLSGVDWRAHLAGLEPSLVGVGSLQECSGEPTGLADLEADLAEAEGSLNFMEYEKALTVIQEARDLVGCLAVPVESGLTARLLFLEGVIHMEQGDKMAAWSSFQGAQIADPDLAWDENFPPDSKPVFIAAKAELAASGAVSLGMAPVPGDVSIWIDGRAVEPGAQSVEIKGRQHWIQWRDDGFHSAELLLEPGLQVGIVLPSGIQDIPLYALTSAAHESVMTTLMASIGAPGDELFLTILGGVWRHTVGQPGFEQLVAPTEEVPALEPPGSKKSVDRLSPVVTEKTPRAWRNPLFMAGTGIALAAGAVTQRGWALAQNEFEAFESEDGVSGLTDYDVYQTTWNEYQSAAKRYRLGGAATIVGVALAGTGLYLGSGESVDAGVWASASELGARFTWTR